MPDPSGRFLLHQIFVNPVFFIQIGIYVHLADVVEQIKIKVFHPAFFQLLFKDFLHLVHVGEVIARKLGRKVIALSRIAAQRLSHYGFRMAIVVAPGRIVIIHALFHGVIHHGLCFRLIDSGIVSINDRKAHGAHAKAGKLYLLKISVNHCLSFPHELPVRAPLAFFHPVPDSKYSSYGYFLSSSCFLWNCIEKNYGKAGRRRS